ncbi:uncharacterized protein LOC130772093 [Actinidia eriantha]|uniref:uncharacterized protein LOC130772093 n=1 Tax=Actinidia eriantha TaxID=165200 RepID=UPI00258ACE8D|nr:uncharacterized protein LOC130772093 [Actinidia eriantha]
MPHFGGHYNHWSMLMENFLRSKEFWPVVETGIAVYASGAVLTDDQQKSLEDQKLKDRKAKNYLFQAIDRAILETILQKDTSNQIWDSMKKKYQGSARVKRQQLQALRREFEILQMKDDEFVDEYFARTLTIANKMRIQGEDLKDISVVEKIMRSMYSKFVYVVCSIEESDGIDKMSIDELQGSLLPHEQKMNSPPSVEEQALKVVTHGESSTWKDSSRGRDWIGGRGRGRGCNDQSSFSPGDQKITYNSLYTAAKWSSREKKSYNSEHGMDNVNNNKHPKEFLAKSSQSEYPCVE